MGTATTEVHGVRVKIEACGHCQATPTQEEIEAAVKRAQEIRSCGRHRCAWCGETIKAVQFSIHHDGHKWTAWEAVIEPAVSLRVQPQDRMELVEHNRVHLGCVEKALPHLNGWHK